MEHDGNFLLLYIEGQHKQKITQTLLISQCFNGTDEVANVDVVADK